jgi:hypothetical protein
MKQPQTIKEVLYQYRDNIRAYFKSEYSRIENYLLLNRPREWYHGLTAVFIVAIIFIIIGMLLTGFFVSVAESPESNVFIVSFLLYGLYILILGYIFRRYTKKNIDLNFLPKIVINEEKRLLLYIFSFYLMGLLIPFSGFVFSYNRSFNLTTPEKLESKIGQLIKGESLKYYFQTKSLPKAQSTFVDSIFYQYRDIAFLDRKVVLDKMDVDIGDSTSIYDEFKKVHQFYGQIEQGSIPVVRDTISKVNWSVFEKNKALVVKNINDYYKGVKPERKGLFSFLFTFIGIFLFFLPFCIWGATFVYLEDYYEDLVDFRNDQVATFLGFLIVIGLVVSLVGYIIAFLFNIPDSNTNTGYSLGMNFSEAWADFSWNIEAFFNGLGKILGSFSEAFLFLLTVGYILVALLFTWRYFYRLPFRKYMDINRYLEPET